MQEVKVIKSASGNTRTRKMVLTSILFAVSLVLAVVENMIPPIPVPIPGVKIGLSNIAVMYTLFFVGTGHAYGVSVLKALFVLTTRGLIAGALSLSGGLLSITVMLMVLAATNKKASYAVTSISGAIAHNVGQFAVITLIYAGTSVWFYFPVLVVSGLVAGLLTAGLLRVVLPAVKRLV